MAWWNVPPRRRRVAHASLDVSSDANLARTARISGSAANFEVGGDLTLGGTLIADITGGAHSAINVGNAANLGGTLQVEFNGHSPVVGDAWTIVNAGSFSGNFAALDTSAAPPLPRGAVYSIDVDVGGNGQVNLAVEGRLMLSVDRATGATAITNAGAAIDFDSYSVLSDNGLLSQGGWTPFQTSGAAGAGWEAANPGANHLSELNLLGSTVINTDESLSLGNAYQAGPVLPSDEDVGFSYTTPDGRVLEGIVEYTGPINDLVLRVDPLTGDAAIQNLSPFLAFDIDSYTITSESGSLVPANWDSFQNVGLPGEGWEEANPRSDHLTELNLTSSKLFSTNTQIEIGQIFDSAGGSQDLVFGYTTPLGQVALGTVQYGEIILVVPGQPGDTNGDGVVNIDDLNNVRNNFGSVGSPDGSLPGDAFPFDGMVDIDDLNGVRNNFGAGPAPVPEPTALLLIVIGATACAWGRRRA